MSDNEQIILSDVLCSVDIFEGYGLYLTLFSYATDDGLKYKYSYTSFDGSLVMEDGFDTLQEAYDQGSSVIFSRESKTCWEYIVRYKGKQDE